MTLYLPSFDFSRLFFLSLFFFFSLFLDFLFFLWSASFACAFCSDDASAAPSLSTPSMGDSFFSSMPALSPAGGARGRPLNSPLPRRVPPLMEAPPPLGRVPGALPLPQEDPLAHRRPSPAAQNARNANAAGPQIEIAPTVRELPGGTPPASTCGRAHTYRPVGGVPPHSCP